MGVAVNYKDIKVSIEDLSKGEKSLRVVGLESASEQIELVALD